MLDAVEDLGNVYKDCSRSLFPVEAVSDILGRSKELVFNGMVLAEAVLFTGNQVVYFDVVLKS